MSFYQGRWINKTRKPHQCWWCGERIEAGAAAHCAAGINSDGEFWSGHAHPECQAACDSMPYDDEGFDAYGFARGSTSDKGPPMFSPDYRGDIAAAKEQP